MSEFIKNFAFFGVLVSLLSYGIGISLKKTIQTPSFQSAVNRYNTYNLTLLSLKMAYVIYYEGAKYISYLLTPATICLAIPLYEQLELLKKNCKLILLGILSGVLTSLCSILALALLFGLSKAEYITLLPKSVTTAIGMGISEELGGYVSITATVIIITGKRLYFCTILLTGRNVTVIFNNYSGSLKSIIKSPKFDPTSSFSRSISLQNTFTFRIAVSTLSIKGTAL